MFEDNWALPDGQIGSMYECSLKPQLAVNGDFLLKYTWPIQKYSVQWELTDWRISAKEN